MTSKTWIFWLFTLLLGSSSLAQAVTVRAQVDNSQEIYPGQSVLYQIVVQGGQADKIDSTPLAPYDPQQRGTSSSTQIINGRMSSSTTTNIVLTVTAPGPVQIPPVTVTVNGRQYQTNPVKFTVSKPGTTDKLRVDFDLSDQHCYVGQPVTMTVRWILMFQISKDNKLSFDKVPIFTSKNFIFDDPPVQGQGQKYAINGVPVLIQTSLQQVNGMTQTVISFQKILIPQRAGTLTLDPVTVSADIVVGQVRTNDFFNPYRNKTQRFAVNSDPVTLQVDPLPTEGRPAGFYGLVGRYHITATAAPTKVNVGDPITLTIRVQGELLKPVRWPELDQVPELAKNFRIPPDKSSPVMKDGALIFTQTLRPTHAQVKRIPPIPLPTFDVDQGRYIVAQSQSIPLQVAPSHTLTAADLQGHDNAPINRELEAIKKGLAANYDGSDCLVNQSFSPITTLIQPSILTLWALPLLGLLGSGVAKVLTSSTPQQQAARRHRRARGIAAQAVRRAAAQPPDQRHEGMAQALQRYIGARFDRAAASITGGDSHDIILKATGNTELAQQFAQLLESCEAAQYAPMSAQIDEAFVQQALDVIARIEKEVRS